MWPHANIGVATGYRTVDTGNGEPQNVGIVVLDVDPRHGGDETIAKWNEEYGLLPHGPACETGGGGQHYYFKHPGGRILSRTIAPGIDIKGDGGQVAAAPSVHISGNSYVWYDGAAHNVPLPDIPEWLLVLMLGRGDGDFGDEHRAPEMPEDVAPGARNSTLASLAGTLRRRGASEQVIFKALAAQNEEWSQPLDITEVAQVAASIARKEPSEAVAILSAPAAAGPKKVKHAYEPQPFTASELELEDIPPIKWAVEGFMPEGLAIFAGKAKIGKSWKALNVSIAVAEGDVVLDVFPTPEADVLMLALEDNKRRLQGRLRKLRPDGRWPERLHLETQWPRADEGGLNALDAWLGQHPNARLVWIDTLAKFKARPQGKRGDIYAEDYDFGQAIQQLALRHSVCIVLITHLNKTLHEDYMDSIQGSAGITGSADTTIYLNRPRGVKGQTTARLRLTGRDIEEQDWSVKFDGATCTWSVEGEFEDSAVGNETRELLRVMEQIGNPVTKEDIAAAMNKTAPGAYKLLYRTALDGLIMSHKGKLFTLLDTNDQVRVHDVRVSAVSSMSAVSAPTTPIHGQEGQKGHADRKDTADIDRENRFDLAENNPMTTNPIGHRANGSKGIGPMGLEAPGQPCADCGEHRWSLRVGNRWMCEVCVPAIVPIREGVL